MEGLIIAVSVIFGLLSLILFFKVWGMCNTVKKIHLKMNEDTRYRLNVNTSP